MAKDLNALWDWIPKLVRRIERIESGALLENSSITGGRMRFIGGLLRIDEGGRVEIVGTLQIDGSSTVTGTFTVDGPWSLDGDGNITGDVTVTGDLNITGGGRIRAGQVVINPSANGGRIEIGGHTIYASGDVVSINHSNGAQIVLNSGGANLIGGGKIIGLSTTGISFVGVPTIVSSLAGGAAPGSAWFNSSGQLHRVIAG